MENLSPLEIEALEDDLADRSPSKTRWRPFLFFERKADDSDIEKVEKTLGVTFPDDLRDDLKNHGGHIPALNAVASQLMVRSRSFYDVFVPLKHFCPLQNSGEDEEGSGEWKEDGAKEISEKRFD